MFGEEILKAEILRSIDLLTDIPHIANTEMMSMSNDYDMLIESYRDEMKELTNGCDRLEILKGKKLLETYIQNVKNVTKFNSDILLYRANVINKYFAILANTKEGYGKKLYDVTAYELSKEGKELTDEIYSKLASDTVVEFAKRLSKEMKQIMLIEKKLKKAKAEKNKSGILTLLSIAAIFFTWAAIYHNVGEDRFGAMFSSVFKQSQLYLSSDLWKIRFNQFFKFAPFIVYGFAFYFYQEDVSDYEVEKAMAASSVYKGEYPTLDAIKKSFYSCIDRVYNKMEEEKNER